MKNENSNWSLLRDIIIMLILFICLLLHMQRLHHDNEVDKKVSEIIKMQNIINDKFNNPFNEWFNCNLINN